MATPRTKSLSTKVTEAEYALVQALAGTQTVSEWARAVLLKAAQPDPIPLVVLAEMIAVRRGLDPSQVRTMKMELPGRLAVGRTSDRS